MHDFIQWVLQPIRVELPGRFSRVRLPTKLDVSVNRAKRPAGVLAAMLPLILMAAGVAIAVICADWAEQPDRLRIGTFGVEAGAALWFAGAISLGLRRAPTVLRAFGLMITGVVGVLLVVAAFVLEWSGAALTLAMEFGVGALAIVVIDVLLLGIVHPGIEQFAEDRDSSVVRIRLTKSWHLVDVSVEHADDAATAGGR